MKKLSILILVLALNRQLLYAQGVGIGTNSPHASAILDITHSSKGVLIQRMTPQQVLNIQQPAKGLLVYDSTSNQLMVNKGTNAVPNWLPIGSSSTGWSLTGNAGTNSSTHFIGTTDNAGLQFRIRNRFAGMIDSAREATYLGFRTGEKMTGYGNTAMGYQSFMYNVNGSYNSALGSYALHFNTEGDGNVAIGSLALYLNTTGNSNTAVGNIALSSNTTGTDNTAVGSESLSLNSTGSYNTAVGSKSLAYNTTGYNNAAHGYGSLFRNTTGHSNVAMGSLSLNQNTIGIQNTAVGLGTLYSNTTGNGNVAVGHDALYTNQSGYNNTATGYKALVNNTTGYYNTAVGQNALYMNSTGINNTAVGVSALYNTTASNNNTMLGYHAGTSFNLGWNNTFLGAESNATADGIFNSVAIGSFVSIAASNIVRIGNASTTSIGGKTGWSVVSDGRFKKDVAENVLGLDFIMKLRPVTYHLEATALQNKLSGESFARMDDQMKKALAAREKILETGLIAQEVEQAATALGYDFSGIDKPKNEKDHYGLRYSTFVVPLVKGMQEQQKIIADLKNMNAEKEKLINELLLRLEKLETANK